jgi:hypothetical protein
MEDTSDEEGSDDESNQLPDLSKSVAQEKLKALLKLKSKPDATTTSSSIHQPLGAVSTIPEEEPDLTQPVEIPAPRLLYPYNLPPPNPPTTPRTTRRKMLAVEIPESLRRNLLWERQVSQAHPRGLKRSASSGDVVVRGWEIPNVVKLTPKVQKGGSDRGQQGGGGGGSDRGQQGGAGGDEEEERRRREESRRSYLARTRSWLFEYHVAGW